MSSTVLRLEDLSKQFGSEVVLRDVNLNLYDDEILTLIGPSGCGKTTLLRIIAGLEKPDDGQVELKGQVVSGSSTFVHPEQRNVGFVFQDLALFPHLTVLENVSFGLKGSPADRERRLNEILDLVGMTDYRDRYPENLSGGQKQRVALARSLVVWPSVLLMDEPFNNLDKGLRERLRSEVRDILQDVNIPTIFVTHDQEEALMFGDRTAVMSEGVIEQVSEPERITTHPDNRFVADFIGPTEFIPARLEGGEVRTEFDTFPADQVTGMEAEEFELMVRGDDLRVKAAAEEERDGVIEDAEFLGGFFRYKVRLPSGRHIYSLSNHSNEFPPGTPVEVSIEPGHELRGFPTDGAAG